MYRKIILIITIALFPMLSIFINNKMDFYTPIVKCVKNIVLNTEDWNGKQEFSLLSSKSLITNVKLNNNNTIVIATFGQSNAANYGEGFYKPKGKVYQYYNGSVYDGSSPMLGATGGGDSVWPYLGEYLSMKLNKNILFINFAIGATCVDQWKIKNQYFKRMIKKIDDFKNKTQLNIDYFVYHQGECDNNKNTPLKIYLSSLTQIFSQLHNKYKSKIILNIASRTVFKKDINITKAQYLVIKDNKFVYEGVNTDIKLKDMDYRFGVHFSKKGLERFGELLSYKLIKLEGVQ